MKYLLFFILFFSTSVHAEIFRCINKNGETSYSEKPCADDNQRVDIAEPNISIVTFKDKIELKENKLKVIYTGKNTGRKSRFVRVSIHEEEDSYMIFYVEGYYNGPPNGRAEFRVLPNIDWGAHSYSTSEKGFTSGYSRVGMGPQADSTGTSDIITLQLWYYSPSDKPTVLETIVIPYKKEWKKSTSNNN